MEKLTEINTFLVRKTTVSEKGFKGEWIKKAELHKIEWQNPEATFAGITFARMYNFLTLLLPDIYIWPNLQNPQVTIALLS